MATLLNNYQNNKGSWDAIKDLSSIDNGLKQHLLRVYSTLAATLAMAAIGAWAHLAYNLGGALTTLALLGFIFIFTLTPHTPENTPKRTAYLFALGFFQGCSIGPLVGLALDVDSWILVHAFVGTFALFACFTGSALLAQRRSLLYLGALLSSGLTIMFWLGVVNLFIQTEALYNLSLYGGLLLFSGFIMYDTQLLIEKYRLGHDDHLAHSLELFLDFIAIFVRLVIILLKNAKKSKD